MTKKWLVLIPVGLILSACNSTATTSLTPPQTQTTPTEVVTGVPKATTMSPTFAPSDLTDKQLDKDMAAVDLELSALEKDSVGVEASFNDTPIDVNK